MTGRIRALRPGRPIGRSSYRAALAALAACGLFAALAPVAGAATFSNTAPIAIPAGGNATPYPSPIAVSGLTGTTTDVNVRLNNFSHTAPGDVAVVLVPPAGTNILLMDGPGLNADVSDVNITFDDAAPTVLPQSTAFPSGSYKPTVYFTGDSFPAPGPGTTYCNPGPAGGGTCTLASALNGSNPNGTWNLYVIDVEAPDAGSIAGGWTLDITSAVVPVQRTLTVAKNGAGGGTVTGTGINCGGDCTEAYADGSSVVLTAAADAGSTFAGWTGCDNPSGNTCTVSLTASKSVTATFSQDRTLTVVKTGDGTVTGPGIDCGSDCTQVYIEGTRVVLIATPAAGSSFVSWGPGCDNASGNTCTTNLNTTRLVTATFVRNPIVTKPVVPPVDYVPPRPTCPPGTSAGVSCQRNAAGGLTITGTRAADRIVGSSGPDVIRCGDGDDVVESGSGNDDIRCGAGNDTIGAGAGSDSVDGESGNDRADGGPGNDRIAGGSGADTLPGGSGNDVIGGGAGNDKLDGRSGNDRLSGASGRDSLVAGTGRDRLSGGSGNDRLNTRDRRRGDSANCGESRRDRDRASVDRGDRVRGCERVRRRR